MKSVDITDTDLQTFEMMGGAVNSGKPDAGQPGRTIVSLRNDHIVWYNAFIRRIHDTPAEPPSPPPVIGVVEIPAWGSVPGDSNSNNRVFPASNGVVYTMKVPGNGKTVRATGAIVPAGSGSIAGMLSKNRGELVWDGTGGGAGGVLIDSIGPTSEDVWLTWRLGVDQPNTNVNLLIQYL